MGLKSNSNIFRLGKKNYEWKSKYYEKTSKELATVNFKNIEIIEFLKRFLKSNGLILQNYRLHFCGSILYLEISYYSDKQSSFLITMNHNKIQFKKKHGNNRQKTPSNTLSLLKNSTVKRSRVKKIPLQTRLKFKSPRRLKLLKRYESYLKQNKYKNTKHAKNNKFLEKLVESLSIYTDKKYQIFLYITNINNKKTYSNIKKDFKFELIKFRRYHREKYYNEGINLLISAINQKNISSKLISEFVAYYLVALKNQKKFMRFLMHVLKTFIESKISKISGLKLVIKGRINGRPRSKTSIIKTGKISLQTFNTEVDYSQSTAITPNGNLGVKVWSCKENEF